MLRSHDFITDDCFFKKEYTTSELSTPITIRLYPNRFAHHNHTANCNVIIAIPLYYAVRPMFAYKVTLLVFEIFCCSTFFLSITNSIENKPRARGGGMYCLHGLRNSRRVVKKKKKTFFPFGSSGDNMVKLNIGFQWVSMAQGRRVVLYKFIKENNSKFL